MRFSTPQRAQLVARAAVMLLCAVISLGAQGPVIVRAGSGTKVQVAPGSTLAVPFSVDLSAAQNTTVSSITVGVAFDQTRLVFDSVAFGGFLVDYGGGNGTPLNLFMSGSTSGTVTPAGVIYFSALPGTGSTTLALTPTAAADTAFANILPLMRVQNLGVCIAPTGVWGDVDNTPGVNIIDAQQIARFSVGLSVANSALVTAQGDVNGDNSVNIIDAQQIARFTVGLGAGTRVNTSASAPTIATLAISSVLDASGGGTNVGVPANLAGLSTGTQAQLIPVAKDAGNVDVTPCTGITYGSSNPAVATVSSTGLVNAISSGTATLTVTSGSFNATTNVTVVAGGGTNVWSNAGTGNWSVPSNWSLGRVPVSTDSVFIGGVNTYTVNVDVPATGKFIVVGGASGTQTLFLTSKPISTTAGIVLNSNAVLNSINGTIGGTGPLVNNGTMNLSDGTVNTLVANLGLIVQGGATTFASSLSNGTGATFRVVGDVNCCNGTSVFGGNLANAGLVELTSNGGSNATISIPNSSFALLNGPGGTINVLGSSGLRAITGVVQNAGAVSVSAGTDLTLGANFSNVAGGSVNVGVGRTLLLRSGAVFDLAGGSVAGAGTLDVNNAGIRVSTPSTINLPLVNMTNGSFTGSQTLTVPIIQTLTMINSTMSGPLVSQGATATKGTSSFGNGVSVPSSGSFRVVGDLLISNATTTVSGGFSTTNGAVVQLTSVNGIAASALNVASGTFTNASTISALSGTGGARSMSATVSNLAGGVLDVTSADLTIGGSQTFTNTAGTINVGANRLLNFIGTSSLAQAGGALTGSGTVAFSGTTLTVSSAFTPGVSSLFFSPGVIAGTAPITIPASTTLTFAGGSISAPFTNQGLTLIRNAVNVNGTLSNASGGTIRIQGDVNCCSGVLTVASGFTNSGTIDLTSINGVAAAQLTVSSGTLVNAPGSVAPGGTINLLAGTGGARTIQGTVSNQGIMNVTPGSASQVSFIGNLTFTGSSTLNLDVIGAPLSTDNLNVSGTTTMGGTLNLNAISVTRGQNFQVITGNVLGGFSAMNSNYAPGFLSTLGTVNLSLSAK